MTIALLVNFCDWGIGAAVGIFGEGMVNLLLEIICGSFMKNKLRFFNSKTVVNVTTLEKKAFITR
ncbi:hypothetical protein LC613_14085 [Nostoc sphaeroides CHAB 2801]|uniref:Uncharacterized protein n=1 Tax=Nostoc sphaeroides CCNUC1 TaxID=2653204 RepID=A0A5P8VXJ1_9NOSO|nr:hypothetical protein [Nostoc sphaeroides]MCC5629142.1 hypothetical protein [Nostoc sphaeroides CHAB 2801]QFS44619.1 hypothetical protein GXM_02094 [Nostoc sphaeroides CCNUC1]